ncbi:tRNA pseudouridine(38-40) synthase TruA [Weissella diestrammenae]|uniref:tRNA pseudouridine synthase A n=1 Tax=Weissella diestrammenae TaxID=1162633 RepID=A0A7G9T3I6_9LACO|nr:tRNA pseudouridine(38-40) synthase TruA [Weissella diestrammenae]MCM0582632.1 tRNA pseudouridine(38-40) synthase TruA [Weissella diestrammenae]QNN74661.1 tRNA pseudouridine(38-40) synthase TruA [Weissella diestrammenae]
MPRYRAIIAYDGTDFYGWQVQPGKRTVQGELEKAVNQMAKNPEIPIRVQGSGRTDAGVHALGQVVHFDLPYQIPANGVRKGLATMLPFDIGIEQVDIVADDFHAQYSAHTKTYRYQLSNREFRAPFRRNYTGYWPRRLDYDKMAQAIPDYLGEHDWISFAASGFQAKTTVRTVTDVKISQEPATQEITFEFTGTGFLYNQIRIMVGVLLEIGMGTRPVDDIPRLLAAKDRQQARLTAPASGLYLKSVDY